MAENELVYLLSAKKDIEDITVKHLDYVGVDSARNILNRLINRIAQLKTFPQLGSLCRQEELMKKGYRYLVCDQYICIYKVSGSKVIVYHIIHHLVDYPDLFKIH